MIVNIVGGKGQIENESPIANLRIAVTGLCQQKWFIIRFTRDSLMVNSFLEVLKNKGLNRETYAEAKSILDGVPKKSPIRIKLKLWLIRTMSAQCRLKIGQTPLPVSTDSIESLMGVIKNIIGRNTLPEFGRSVLAVPAVCGRQTAETLQAAFSKVNHADLQKWQSENRSDSLRKKRKMFLRGKIEKSARQDQPIAKAA